MYNSSGHNFAMTKLFVNIQLMFFIFFLAFLTMPFEAFACSVCGQNDSFFWSFIFLIVIPYLIVFSIVGYFFYTKDLNMRSKIGKGEDFE